MKLQFYPEIKKNKKQNFYLFLNGFRVAKGGSRPTP